MKRKIPAPRVFYGRPKWWVAQDGHETDGPFDSRAEATAWMQKILDAQHHSAPAERT